jgi:hypothetical protein
LLSFQLKGREFKTIAVDVDNAAALQAQLFYGKCVVV